MKPLTNQEIFDLVACGLVEQGERSATSGGTCVYHDPLTNNRCAVGMIFKAQEFDILAHTPVMVGGVMGSLNWMALESFSDEESFPEAFTALYGGADGYDAMELRKALLCSLQSLHDTGTPASWGPALGDIAEEWKLAPDKLHAAEAKISSESLN